MRGKLRHTMNSAKPSWQGAANEQGQHPSNRAHTSSALVASVEVTYGIQIRLGVAEQEVRDVILSARQVPSAKELP